MFCHKCGIKSLEDAAFCQKCGEKLIVENSIQQKPLAEVDNSEIEILSKSMFVVLIRCIGLIIFGLVIGAI
jgi:uncharacterized membrane protein YvbJ